MVFDVNGEITEVLAELKKLLDCTDHNYLDLNAVKYTIAFEAGTSYGIGSRIHCAGFTERGCSMVGTVGGFVRHSRGAQLDEGFALITTAHTIVCKECRDKLQQPQRIFVKDDEEALLMISGEVTVSSTVDTALVILNDQQCEQVRESNVDLFFVNEKQELLDGICDSRNIRPNLPVQKFGITSKRTTGTVTYAHYNIYPLAFRSGFVINGDAEDFSAGGDSGSFITSIVNDSQYGNINVYGILVGGSIGKTPKDTYAVRMTDIFDEFSKLGHHIRFMSVQEYDEYKYVSMQKPPQPKNTNRNKRNSGVFMCKQDASLNLII